MTLRQRDEMAEAQPIGSVRARLARIAWVGVLLVVAVVGLLAWLAVRYATTVDTMRAWVDENGTVVAEIPEGQAGRVAPGQAARVRIAGRWYAGRVEAGGANPFVEDDENDPGEGHRYVRLRLTLVGAAGGLPAGAQAEVRVAVGWPG